MQRWTAPTHSSATLVSHALPAAQQVVGDESAITGCTTDPGAVRPGDALVLVESSPADAEAAQQAVDRGAVAIVSQHLLPIFGIAQYVVPDANLAYSTLCHALLEHPTTALNAIAIAGPHGKTSIALLLDSIFKVAGRSAACQTNQGVRFEGQENRFLAPSTAAGIADFLDESVASGCRLASVELSEEVLRSKMASGAAFDVVCLSSITADRSIASNQSPWQRRQTFASALKLLGPHGMAVLNADDDASMRLVAEYNGPVMTFGLSHPAEVTGFVTDQHACGQTLLLSIDNDTAAVQTSIIGQAHAQNCLAAAAMATVYGISLPEIAKGLEQVNVLPGVMQRVDAGQGVATFLDRGESPSAKIAALEAARQVTSGRVIAVVGQACSIVSKLADAVVCTGGLGSAVAADSTMGQLLATLQVKNAEQRQCLVEKLFGLARALRMAREGDVVLLSGLDRGWLREAAEMLAVEPTRMVSQLLRHWELEMPHSNRDAA